MLFGLWIITAHFMIQHSTSTRQWTRDTRDRNINPDTKSRTRMSVDWRWFVIYLIDCYDEGWQSDPNCNWGVGPWGETRVATPTTPSWSRGRGTNKRRIITSTINTLIAITWGSGAAACKEQLWAPIILIWQTHLWKLFSGPIDSCSYFPIRMKMNDKINVLMKNTKDRIWVGTEKQRLVL